MFDFIFLTTLESISLTFIACLNNQYIAQYMWVKDVKMSTSKEIYKNDFMCIESTLNVSKVSTLKETRSFICPSVMIISFIHYTIYYYCLIQF